MDAPESGSLVNRILAFINPFSQNTNAKNKGLDLKDVTYLADLEGEGLSLHHLHQAADHQPTPDTSDHKEKGL